MDSDRALIVSQFEELVDLPSDATAVDKRRRGKRFEVFLRSLLDNEQLDARVRIRLGGEEIDGSFVLDGRVFLLEAKWHAEPIPAASVYAFKGKVDGKLVGTVGLFVSMSGYSSEAIDALTAGKSLNVLLFDREDIESALSAEYGFTRALRSKQRAAADQGLVFFPYRAEQVTHAIAATPTITHTFASTIRSDAADGAGDPDVVIVCEGLTDRNILSSLVSRILETEQRSATLRIVAAMGKLSLPLLANQLWKELPESVAYLIVADSDGDAAGTVSSIESGLQQEGVGVVAVDPSLEVWLLPDADEPHRELRRVRRQTGAPTILRTAEHLAEAIDLSALRQNSPSFRQLVEFVLAHVRAV